MSESFELFHVVADAGSARVRRFVTERELTGVVRFRNLTYDEPLAALKQHDPSATAPALWDGEKLFVGADAAIARLSAHLDVGRD